MRAFVIALGLVAAVALAVPATSHAIGLEVAVGGWQQDPSGTVSYKAVGLTDSIDLEKEAGYDKETQVYARAKIDLPVLPNVYLMATPMEFDGKGQKNVDFKFGDTVFTAGVPFDSKVTLNQYDIALYYGIPFLGVATLGKLNAEVGLNLKLIDLSVEVAGTDIVSLANTQTQSVTVPVPMLYLGARLKPVDLLSIEVEGRGISYSGNDYYDLIGRLKVKPFGPMFLAAGYRYQDISIEDEKGISADIEVSGPFVEAGIEF